MPFYKSVLNKNALLLGDILILLLIIAGISVFQKHADLVLLGFWFAIVLYGLFSRRFKSLIHLVISTGIAFGWVYIARNKYGYNYTYLTIAGMNLLPILSWALGMIGVSEIFNHIHFKNYILKFIIFVPVFWILLILIETYSFHTIEIRNTMTGNSLGLPFCNCIHAPWWMRIVYFTMGPAYYILTLLIDYYVDKLSLIQSK